MAFFDNFLKKFGSIRGKKYTGILPGGLPASQNWGDSAFLKANDVSLYTNRAVGKRAEKVGEIEFEIKDARGEVIENDPLLDVLNKPNDLFSGVEFWKLHQTYVDVVGESYIWIETARPDAFSPKSVTGLHILKPDLVKAIVVDGKITEYEYQTTNKTYTYPAEEIMRSFRPDPINPMRGVSLLKAGIHAIQTEQQIGAYHARILENGGKIEGLMKFKTERLSKEQLDEIKLEYEKEYADARNAGRPLFVGGDTEYTNLGLTPQEMAFMDAKKMTLEDIIIMTGVPKILLGTVNDVQYSNADASMRTFLRETVVPLLKALTGALQSKIGVDGRVITFVDPTPENIDEELKITESGIANHYMSTNEARERHGLDPVDGGDDILVPWNLVPLSAGRVAPTPAAPTETEDDDDEDTNEKRIKAATQHPLQDAEMRQMWAKVAIKRADSREKIFAKKLNEYLDGQEKRILDLLQPTKTRVFRKKGLFDEVINMPVEITIGKGTLLPILNELLKQAGTDAMKLAGSEYAFNMTGDILGWMDGRTDLFLQSINETTFKTLKTQFDESFAAGESRAELVKRVQDTYGNISEARAKTIARTEIHNATQYATIEGYRQAGLSIKIWVTVLDSRTRSSHASLDGEERPLDIPFSNGLMFPGDPNGSAEETINCRCVN